MSKYRNSTKFHNDCYVCELELKYSKVKEKTDRYRKALQRISYATWDKAEFDRDSVILRKAVQIAKQSLEDK